MSDREPKAFWSYTHLDDEHSRGQLTAIRQRLENEVRVQLGASFPIYQDREDLTWGTQWKPRILTGVLEAFFFLPVITPSYFKSSACREELAAFMEREQSLGYEELILPIYYINVDFPDDELVTTVTTRQYVDFRKLRTARPGDRGLEDKIVEVAEQLIGRLKEFYQHQLNRRTLTAIIKKPVQNERVGHVAQATVAASDVPDGIHLWAVVEAANKYHPQSAITSSLWKGPLHIGSGGFGKSHGHSFPIHVIAANDSVNDRFNHYREQQPKLPTTRQYRGLSRPATGTRILATTVVHRDDHAALLASLVGTYDECRSRPVQATGGIIAIQSSASGALTLTATNKSGNDEWRGTIGLDATTGHISAEYTYLAKSSRGKFNLKAEANGEIVVTGRDDHAPPGAAFFMLWKKRSS